MEVLAIAAVLGVLAKFAMPKLATPATMTLQVQAQSAADLIRRAQSLAMTRGQRMSVAVAEPGTNGRLAIACASGATPCSTDAAFTASQGAVVGNNSTIYFNTLGQPVDVNGSALSSDSSFTLSFATGGTSTTHTVTVAAITGRVSVSP